MKPYILLVVLFLLPRISTSLFADEIDNTPGAYDVPVSPLSPAAIGAKSVAFVFITVEENGIKYAPVFNQKTALKVILPRLNKAFSQFSWNQLSFKQCKSKRNRRSTFGPYNYRSDASGYSQEDLIIEQIAPLAKAEGLDVQQCDHVFFVLPDLRGILGMAGDGINETAGVAPLPPRNTVTVRKSNSLTVHHEFGHSLGLKHSSEDLNGDIVISPDEEYGDVFSLMGIGEQLSFTDRLQLGWYDKFSRKVLKLQKKGTYQFNLSDIFIHPLKSANFHGLFLLPEGVVPSLTVSKEQGSLTIRRYSRGFQNTALVAVLAEGETFRDALSGTTISHSVNLDNGSTVQVVIPNLDSDRDGIADDQDPDNDNDGISDTEDCSPFAAWDTRTITPNKNSLISGCPDGRTMLTRVNSAISRVGKRKTVNLAEITAQVVPVIAQLQDFYNWSFSVPKNTIGASIHMSDLSDIFRPAFFGAPVDLPRERAAILSGVNKQLKYMKIFGPRPWRRGVR